MFLHHFFSLQARFCQKACLALRAAKAGNDPWRMDKFCWIDKPWLVVGGWEARRSPLSHSMSVLFFRGVTSGVGCIPAESIDVGLWYMMIHTYQPIWRRRWRSMLYKLFLRPHSMSWFWPSHLYQNGRVWCLLVALVRCWNTSNPTCPTWFLATWSVVHSNYIAIILLV